MDNSRYSERRIWVLDEGLFTRTDEAGIKASEALRLSLERLMKKLGPTHFWVGTPLVANFFQPLGTRGKIYVLGHGSPSSVGGLSPTALATQLVQNGALSSGCKVTLVSCNTATKWFFWESTFASKLKKALAARGCDCTVVGRTGTATVTKAGSVRTYAPWYKRLFGTSYKSQLGGKRYY